MACEEPSDAFLTSNRKLLQLYDHPDIPMRFDLSKDMGKVHNIAATQPEAHEQLHDQMMN